MAFARLLVRVQTNQKSNRTNQILLLYDEDAATMMMLWIIPILLRERGCVCERVILQQQ